MTFFFFVFFSLFEGKDPIENEKKTKKKREDQKENWEKKEFVPTICASNKEKTKSFRPTRAHI